MDSAQNGTIAYVGMSSEQYQIYCQHYDRQRIAMVM